MATTKERPLWEKCYVGWLSATYLNAARIIGHAGCSESAFFDAAGRLPGYDKYRYENAVRDLTVLAKREQGDYRLHDNARKVLRAVLGPAPGSPDYGSWWQLRLASLADMTSEGLKPAGPVEPPVPLEGPKAPEAKKPRRPKKPAAKRAPARKKAG